MRYQSLVDNDPNYTPLELEQSDMDDLTHLKKSFVFTGVDKANQDVSLTCKKHYATILLEELLNNDTYERINNRTVNQILDQHANHIHTHFGTKWSFSTRRFPVGKGIDRDIARFKSIPKYHKEPLKARFIAGSGFCSTRQLAQKINIFFNPFQTQH